MITEIKVPTGGAVHIIRYHGRVEDVGEHVEGFEFVSRSQVARLASVRVPLADGTTRVVDLEFSENR